MDGEMVPWDDAKIHVLSHVIHYGSAVFEGARLYKHPRGLAMWRMRDHVARLYESARLMRMEIPFSRDEIHAAIAETVKANGLGACYVRPVVYRGPGPAGVNPLGNPVQVFIAAWEWGKYLGEEGLTEGVDVCVSSFRRMAPDTHLAMGKVAGNYVNSSLAKMEAVLGGFAEGILLDVNGHVSEGSGENIFVIYKGRLCTPPLGASILSGITRDCVAQIARDIGLAVEETMVTREMLYIADELFFSGTAAELTPIRSVDRIPVGNGRRGPITERLQDAFFDIIEGRADDPHEWLEFI